MTSAIKQSAEAIVRLGWNMHFPFQLYTWALRAKVISQADRSTDARQHEGQCAHAMGKIDKPKWEG